MIHVEAFLSWALTDSNSRPLPCKGLSGGFLIWENLTDWVSVRRFASGRFRPPLVVSGCHVDALWSRVATCHPLSVR